MISVSAGRGAKGRATHAVVEPVGRYALTGHPATKLPPLTPRPRAQVRGIRAQVSGIRAPPRHKTERTPARVSGA